ncbi:calmodulin-binding protein [Streptosporangium sp. NPDC087985]|uniref:BP74-related protein n=1 Tax=Streptosporangium sp. NPDC087985 TaxID=3366196 RepID=UPI00380FD9C2
MRRIRTRVGIPAAAALLALLTVAPPAVGEQAGGATSRAAAEDAYFEFAAPPNSKEFVIKLTDPVMIRNARDILSGKETNAVHVMGRIVKRPAPYNPGWSFSYDPATISFFAFAIEVCDASTMYVEDHLDEAGGAFLPGNFWCPWSSRLTREIPAP